MGSNVDDRVGRIVDGRYELVEHLGGGTMGEVFRAKHVKVGRAFAIKILHDHLVRDAKAVSRFEREAQIASRLRHPNVVPVLDLRESDGMTYLLMELAIGDSLASLLDRSGAFERARAVRVIGQLCDALAYAHGLGLVHRDLKPENIIVETTPAGDVARIIDFGVAILREGVGGDGGSSGRLTTAGIVLGSPHYVAPEVATGRAFDHRADLFGLGIVCFELLTGRMPYDGQGVDVVYANVATETPAMAERAPAIAVDPLLEAFTRKLLAKDPDARFASAGEARRVLDLIEGDRVAAAIELGIDARPLEPVIPATVTAAPSVAVAMAAPRRSRLRWAVPLAATLAIVLGAFTVLGHDGAPPNEPAVVPSPVAAAAVVPPATIVTPPALQPAPLPVPPAPAPHHAAITTAHAPRPAPTIAPPPKPAHDPYMPLEACTDRVVHAPPPPNAVVSLYVSVGKHLGQLGRSDGVDELWQTYRLIRIQDALVDDQVRARTVALLDDIERRIDRRPR